MMKGPSQAWPRAAALPTVASGTYLCFHLPAAVEQNSKAAVQFEGSCVILLAVSSTTKVGLLCAILCGSAAGAIFAGGSSVVTVTDSRLLSNVVTPEHDFDMSADGGACFVNGSATLRLYQTLVRNNSAFRFGGGIAMGSKRWGALLVCLRLDFDAVTGSGAWLQMAHPVGGWLVWSLERLALRGMRTCRHAYCPFVTCCALLAGCRRATLILGPGTRITGNSARQVSAQGWIQACGMLICRGRIPPSMPHV